MSINAVIVSADLSPVAVAGQLAGQASLTYTSAVLVRVCPLTNIGDKALAVVSPEQIQSQAHRTYVHAHNADTDCEMAHCPMPCCSEPWRCVLVPGEIFSGKGGGNGRLAIHNR